MNECGDNVVSLATRKPYHEEQAELRKERRANARRKRQAQTEAHKEHKESVLEILDKMRALVEAGKLEGLVIISRDPKSRHFFTDIALDGRIHPTGDLYAWIGVMGAIELELKESSLMAPSVQHDGSILDPYEEIESRLNEMDEEDYFE